MYNINTIFKFCAGNIKRSKTMSIYAFTIVQLRPLLQYIVFTILLYVHTQETYVEYNELIDFENYYVAANKIGGIPLHSLLVHYTDSQDLIKLLCSDILILWLAPLIYVSDY